LGRTSQALHTLHATTEGKKDLNPSQPNTAHRVSESFFALSMSVTQNGNSTVHSASAEFQTNSVIHPSPNQPSGVFIFPLYTHHTQNKILIHFIFFYQLTVNNLLNLITVSFAEACSYCYLFCSLHWFYG